MDKNKEVSNRQTLSSGDDTNGDTFVNCRPLSTSREGILTIDPNQVYEIQENSKTYMFFGYQIITAISNLQK